MTKIEQKWPKSEQKWLQWNKIDQSYPKLNKIKIDHNRAKVAQEMGLFQLVTQLRAVFESFHVSKVKA